MPEQTTTPDATRDALPQENGVLPELTAELLSQMWEVATACLPTNGEGDGVVYRPEVALALVAAARNSISLSRRVGDVEREREREVRQFDAGVEASQRSLSEEDGWHEYRCLNPDEPDEDMFRVGYAWNEIDGLNVRIEDLTAERDALMRSLEECTPGGSEYHKDPARCVAWIQDRGRFARDALLARKKAEAERDALAARVRELEAGNRELSEYLSFLIWRLSDDNYALRTFMGKEATDRLQAMLEQTITAAESVLREHGTPPPTHENAPFPGDAGAGAEEQTNG